MQLSDWLFKREQRAHGIALVRLAEYLFEFLVGERKLPEQQVALGLWKDYSRGGRRDRPAFLRRFDLPPPRDDSVSRSTIPRRQARHIR